MDLKVAISYLHYKLNPKLLKKDNIYYKLKKMKQNIHFLRNVALEQKKNSQKFYLIIKEIFYFFIYYLIVFNNI